MVQHVLLTLVAAPLIALSAPITAAPPGRLAGHPPALDPAGPPLAVTRVLAFPVVAWLIFAAVMWVSHFSPLFDAALEDPLIHDLEHVLFLAAALLFWWPAVALDPAPWRMPHPVRALYVFLQMTQNTFLAVVILNAQTVLYPALRDGPACLGTDAARRPADGRGRSCGSPATLIFLTAAMAILVGWSRAEGRDAARDGPAGGGGAGRDPDPRGPSGRPPRARARDAPSDERALDAQPGSGASR